MREPPMISWILFCVAAFCLGALVTAELFKRGWLYR